MTDIIINNAEAFLLGMGFAFFVSAGTAWVMKPQEEVESDE